MPNYAADKLAAAVWARELLEDGTAVILDTETTGLDNDARICQIAIIDLEGNVLLDTLVNPQIPIPAEATAIHGITDEMVKDALTIKDLFNHPMASLAISLLLGWHGLEQKTAVIYNADYDTRILRQHIRAIMPDFKYAIVQDCAMLQYAKFVGDWNDYYKSYRWKPLPASDLNTAHSALGDCLSVLALLKRMADYREDVPF